jgi:hypothetical protein
VGRYLATWSVFVVGDDAKDPVTAAKIAREMADDHSRSMWGIEETKTGKTVTVDLELGAIDSIDVPGEEVDEVA